MFRAVCDLCGHKVDDMSKIATLTPEYQIPGRIVHICEKCGKKVNKQLITMRDILARQLANDMRNWLLTIKVENTNLE